MSLPLSSIPASHYINTLGHFRVGKLAPDIAGAYAAIPESPTCITFGWDPSICLRAFGIEWKTSRSGDTMLFSLTLSTFLILSISSGEPLGPPRSPAYLPQRERCRYHKVPVEHGPPGVLFSAHYSAHNFCDTQNRSRPLGRFL
jgi:hypothetical protein